MYGRTYKMLGGDAYDAPLVERQARLRARYAAQPSAAIIVKRARTGPGDSRDAVHGTVMAENTADPARPYGVAWEYGVDRAVGGLHDAPNPGELLCAALAACTDASIRMSAEVLGVRLDHPEVEVSGRLDARGALGERGASVGFLGLAVAVRLRAAPETPPARVELVAATAERLCVVLATLRSGVPVALTFDA
jgi:uncharacterized OsmC-like protein